MSRRFQQRLCRVAEVISAEVLSSRFNLAGGIFSARRFICIGRKIIGAQVIFLSLQRHCFMVIRKRSFLHCIEKMIIRVVKSMSAALHHSQVQSGNWDLTIA
ncbi:hypothetical protein CUJ84_Chr003811 [Rhizobium leguminosarum]|uniref:Uncharacterized protein n=1 Tax=Rhizobium leguminosarum TaxID=384 RepID=A0A2K9Z7D0_RHILE|nr:hypothetical protein CUJ84_Chr003811 [Rhizobium leguminosarum]